MKGKECLGDNIDRVYLGNGVKTISRERVEEFIREFGSDAMATLTMGQLLGLVERESAAQARIQELEALCDNYNSMCSQ